MIVRHSYQLKADGRQCALRASYWRAATAAMKYWEIIADNLSKAGWSWDCVSVLDSEGRTIWIADAHRGDGKRFIVSSDEMLTAFVELQRAIHEFAVSLIS